MIKILAFGMNGFVGTRVRDVLEKKYEFTLVSRSSGVDITDKQSVFSTVSSTDASLVFNFSAKANVDACEQDKSLGEEGEAWQVNVEGVKNIVAACQDYKKKLLHISTDFVFDGEKGEPYREDDRMNPIDWYGVTKANGDEAIFQSDIEYLILRPAFPYTFLSMPKHFVAAMYKRLAAGEMITGITDETFSPTWIDDLANAIELLVQKNAFGVYNVGGSAVTPHSVASEIAKTFGFASSLISKTTREKYFAGKAPRPRNTNLDSTKLEKLGITLTTFNEGLQAIKRQHETKLHE